MDTVYTAFSYNRGNVARTKPAIGFGKRAKSAEGTTTSAQAAEDFYWYFENSTSAPAENSTSAPFEKSTSAPTDSSSPAPIESSTYSQAEDFYWYFENSTSAPGDSS